MDSLLVEAFLSVGKIMSFAFWVHSICHSFSSCIPCTLESGVHPPPFDVVGVFR